jgi:hypothetical protein
MQRARPSFFDKDGLSLPLDEIDNAEPPLQLQQNAIGE